MHPLFFIPCPETKMVPMVKDAFEWEKSQRKYKHSCALLGLNALCHGILFG